MTRIYTHPDLEGISLTYPEISAALRANADRVNPNDWRWHSEAAARRYAKRCRVVADRLDAGETIRAPLRAGESGSFDGKILYANLSEIRDAIATAYTVKRAAA